MEQLNKKEIKEKIKKLKVAIKGLETKQDVENFLETYYTRISDVGEEFNLVYNAMKIFEAKIIKQITRKFNKKEMAIVEVETDMTSPNDILILYNYFFEGWQKHIAIYTTRKFEEKDFVK